MSEPMLKHSPTCEWLRRRCNCGAAARAASPGIDVERLARALDSLGWPLRHRQMTAEWIAAEYARLGEAPGE